MPNFEFPDLPSQFRQLLGQCRDLYVSSGELCVREFPNLVPKTETGFVQLMDDLHRALVVKVFVTICEADRRWSTNEKFLGEVLLFHLWSEWLKEDQLKAALQEMSEKATSLKWYALVRPFDQIVPLRERVGELETIVTRLANIVARADGPLKPKEAMRLKMIQDELQRHLRQIPIDEPTQHQEEREARIEAVEKILRDAKNIPDTTHSSSTAQSTQQEAFPGEKSKIRISEEVAGPTETQTSPEEQLQDALAELDRLIGLENIKEEVRTLTNFLKIQNQREQAGLPATNLSLHMVFGGNPGTGKTTVARIVGKIFGAMGILKKGHLVETDRSGLVAEYAGQTGPKTNQRIDEALDGVLFVDEAYTLIASSGEDPFGHEAVQTLLKRMEDDRERLVVILAGYPVEMAILLHSNPGLSSRFSRNLEFVDYTALELAQIFGLMCDKNRYALQPLTRAKVIVGFDYLYARRTRFFGNGRTARNLFEQAIRLMANRIVGIVELTVEQLSTLEPEDIEFDGVPIEIFSKLKEDGTLRFHIVCPNCSHGKDVSTKFLGQGVRCPKCEHNFSADWGSLVPVAENDPEAKSVEE
ncbi:AAA family ATPase [Bythopirellula goksoeyrii]|uniref:Stage V sporulation protein K n=1 Tax=Bythopirellula goksoeyrii TaxID=1400387 RepID=A0A5B9Q5F4_9BACT|nr:AAA family ATPase [Bythopirellula goksoeyrii]QEG32960.1 Stage V sporulation protein K [Bythopirellula goksoeyrii]